MKKRNVLLLISAVIGTIYTIYLISTMAGAPVDSANSSEALGTALAMAMIAPHALMTGLAGVFNWIGWAFNKKWGALVAGILYAVAILFMFMYFMFVVVEMVLCFVAYAQMGKAKALPADNADNGQIAAA